ASYLSASADLNGDGYFDVVVDGQDVENAYYYAGGSGGVSTSPTTIHVAQAAPIAVNAIGTGDIDGDGLGDLFMAVPGYGTLSILFGVSGGPTDSSRRATVIGPAGKTLTGAIW